MNTAILFVVSILLIVFGFWWDSRTFNKSIEEALAHRIKELEEEE